MAGIENINYSLRNLKKNKARSFLTILSIFAGIATIFIFISFGLGLYSYVEELSTSGTADKILIQPAGAGLSGLDDTFSFSDEDLRAIDRTAGVIDYTASYFKTAEIKSNDEIRYSFIISIDPDNDIMLEMFNIDIQKGRELRKGDSGKVVLGYNYMLDDKIFSKGLEINDKIEINDKELKVIGFFEPVGNPQDDSQLYVTNDYFQDLYDDENLSYGMIIAQADKDDVSDTAERIEENLRRSRDLDEGEEDFSVQSYGDMIESFSSALDIVVWFVILIALVSVLVSAVNTANTMITAVLERYKEIGILKAIGARNLEIFSIFLFESAVLGLIAGMVGVGVGFLGTSVASVVLSNLGWSFLQPSYTYLFSNDVFIYCVLFAVLTGAISGVIPSVRASKINTVDALRYE